MTLGFAQLFTKLSLTTSRNNETYVIIKEWKYIIII